MTLANTLELLLDETASELLLNDKLELLLEETEVAVDDGDGFEPPPPPPQAVNITEAIAETKNQEGFFFIHRVLFVKGSSFIEGGDPNIDTMQICVPKV